MAALALFVGYVVLSLVSARGALPPTGLPAFYFPNGWALAFLVRSRVRTWPVLLLSGFAADWITNVVTVFPMGLGAFWAAGDMVETATAAWLLRLTVGKAVALKRVSEVGWFTLITFFVAPITTIPFALLSVGSLPGATYTEVQESWWPTGGLGTFVVGAVALAWSGPRWRRIGWPRLAETVIFSGLVTLLFLLVFGTKDTPAAVILIAFTTFPLLSVAALRYGPRGASLASWGMGVVAAFVTLDQRGLFAEIGTPRIRLLAVQIFYALAMFSALLLAAAVEERRRAARGQALLLDAANVLASPTAMANRLDRIVDLLSQDFAAGAAIALEGEGAGAVAVVAPSESGKAELRRAIDEDGPGLTADREVDGTLLVPLFAAGERVGTLALLSSVGSRFDENDRDIASTFARQLESSVETENLRAAAERHAKEVESNERRFRSLAEATAEVLWVTDAIGQLHGPQPSWSAFSGQTQEEYEGLGWLDAVHPDDRETARSVWARAIATEEPIHSELRFRRKDGAWIYQETSAGPVRDEQGRVREWVGMNIDIQERKTAEEERDRSLRAAQDAIQVRDDFLSIASHELKTPLTPLSTWLQLIQRRMKAGQPIDPAWVAKARASLDRLASLINDLLDASRVQSRRLTVRLEPVSLTEVIDGQVTAAETLSDRHVFVVEGSDRTVWVMGEKARLEQVLNNLVENAIKYSPKGGTIRVRLTLEHGEAVVSVADQGVGIPPDQIGRLFDRFFRARNISPASFGGLGLGLYIVRDIVEHHGGRVWVESEPGVGSTFYVAVPLLGVGSEPPASAAAHV